jgi:hypothetical protein
VQGSHFHYSIPREFIPNWRNYECVEVGYVENAEGKPIRPAELEPYREGGSDVYPYVPVDVVEDFLAVHSVLRPHWPTNRVHPKELAGKRILAAQWTRDIDSPRLVLLFEDDTRITITGEYTTIHQDL